MAATDLSREISAFLKRRSELLRDYGSAWVIFVGDDLEGHFERFEDAARFAVDRFGGEHFLIRHTTDPEPQIPMLVVEA